MTKAIKNFVQHEAAGGIFLVIAAFSAILIANSPFASLYTHTLNLPVSVEVGNFAIDKPLLLWINDGLMAIFFFLIGLEVKREVIEGHLSSRDQIILPGIGAMAGITMPALIYTYFNFSNPLTAQGWAIPAATDIAFALGVFSLFGKGLPLSLKLFLLSVAIFDDIAAIIIIAIFYSQDLSPLSLGIASFGILGLYVLNRLKVSSLGLYLLFGTIVWVAVLKSGVHATLAGFAIAMFIPLASVKQGEKSMLKKLEHDLHAWVAFFILPVFAFSNAGVNFSGIGQDDFFNSVTIGIALGLFLGNQIGIFGACWIAIKLGIARLPKNTTWQQLYGVSLLCGIGFTMSLFIGSLAFEQLDSSYLDKVKIGVLLGSLFSAVLGSIVIARASASYGTTAIRNSGQKLLTT